MMEILASWLGWNKTMVEMIWKMIMVRIFEVIAKVEQTELLKNIFFVVALQYLQTERSGVVLSLIDMMWKKGICEK